MSLDIQTKKLASGANLLSRLAQGFQFNVKSLLEPLFSLRKFGFSMSNDYELATSIFVSRITKFADVKDCSCLKQSDGLNLCAYLEKTNFETEEKIYDVYAQLLDFFPAANIDVKVVELYGRSKDELEPLIE